VSTTDAFLAPVVTEVLLTALARLRTEESPASLCIGSPWLTDVPLFPGIFAGSFPFLLPGIVPSEVTSVGTLLRTWMRNGGRATVLVQSYDPADWPRKGVSRYNELELAFLERCLDSGAEVLIARGFHDKFVVVPDVVISGSANVTYSGLYVNRERMSVHNFSSSPQDYATSLAVCKNQLYTARSAGECAPPRPTAGVVNQNSISEIRRCYSHSWS
jgi:hypothetical protein